MANIQLSFLTENEIQVIHDGTLKILDEIGIRVDSAKALEILAGVPGVKIDKNTSRVRFSESAVMAAIDRTPASFSVYGRDHFYKLDYGQGSFVSQAIPGQGQWVDPIKKIRRAANLDDFEKCVHVADSLPNIDIVGAMVQPQELPVEIMDVCLYAELLKRTRKPVRSWVYSETSAKYILELYRVVSNDKDLKKYPQMEFGFEPISPLILPEGPLDTAITFADAGVPITVGPMPQAMATAPVTLAGSLTQGNAETLATLVILQNSAPGVPFIYFNCPHIMDPRTASLVFSSPEQILFAIAAAQLGHSYGFPVGVNVGLTDSKLPDAQSGLEKGMSLLMGVLAGANIFGGMGISGCDQGFSLPQLIIDDEMIGFIKRVTKGMKISAKTTAVDVVKEVGIGGTFLTHDHTLINWREQFWIPFLCDRNPWDPWFSQGGKTMLEKAVDYQDKLLSDHEFDWIAEDTQRELNKIVDRAQKEVVGL